MIWLQINDTIDKGVCALHSEAARSWQSSLGVVLGECAHAACRLGSDIAVFSPCGAPANEAAELRWLYAELAFAFCHHILRAGTPQKKLQRSPSRR